jgi:hypothetical protein
MVHPIGLEIFGDVTSVEPDLAVFDPRVRRLRATTFDDVSSALPFDLVLPSLLAMVSAPRPLPLFRPTA